MVVRKKGLVSISSLLLLGHLLSAGEPVALHEALERLATQHEQMGKEIVALRALLGQSEEMRMLIPLAAPPRASEELKRLYDEGSAAFEKEAFQEAKAFFQTAWEQAPDIATTHCNLGLAYYRLGNIPMAKRMLQSALDGDPNLKYHLEIKQFLANDVAMVSSQPALSEEERKLRNELLNSQKEMDSYQKSRGISLASKLKACTSALDRMELLAKDSTLLQREFYYQMGEAFVDLEQYDRALGVFRQYEAAMEGEVLPDGYHAKLLTVEEKKKELDRVLSSYLGNQAERSIRRRLAKNLHELEIFALQLDEFVSDLDEDNTDFHKIAKRLSEYPWGKRPARHVMVVNRFSELIYSNLDGTLPIERYQDVEGRRFLKEITQLADRMQLKQTEFVEVRLNVSGKVLPYVVMFTYIPKHQAYVVVRVPKEELV